MIVWRKLGILGLIIPVGLAISLQLLFGDYHFLAAIGYLLGAIPVWFLGKKWNDAIDLQNQMNSDSSRIKKHSLFWIHLEYWAWIVGWVGLTLLVDTTLFQIGTDPLLIIWGIGILLTVAYQSYLGRNKMTDLLKGERRTKPATQKLTPSATPVPPETFKTVVKNREDERNRILQEYKTEDHRKYMPKSNEDSA